MPEVKNTQNGELQKIQLNILREFDLFCREHNIKYYIIGGSAILLFFTSVFTYSVNVSQSDYVFSLVKEALLEFVLLDTVIYSIISNIRDYIVFFYWYHHLSLQEVLALA